MRQKKTMKKHNDKMTAKERIKSLILNRPIDRVPFIASALGFLAVDNGINIYDYFTKPEAAFKAGVESAKRYPWAFIRPVYGWGDHGAWEFGGKIKWPESVERMTPCTPEPLITKPEEVDSLPEPDPLKTEWFRLVNQFNALCIQNGFSALLPSASIMAPLCSIVEGTRCMKWIIKYPGSVHSLAEKVLRFNMRAAEIILKKYGARNCSATTELPWESNSVISPAIFEEFCLPYIKRLHGFYLERGVLATMIHLCGDHKGNLKFWKDVPIPERTIFSIGDDMDLKETGDFLGDAFILAGNISTSILQSGTREKVKEEVKRCLNQAKGRSGGFILMPACEYPPLAPKENFEAVREALLENGFY